jgi:hypothetical protein
MARQPTEHELALLDAVLEQLKRYRGEPIVAGEHPLHKAVVELERVCWHFPFATKQPYRLWPDAWHPWFNTIKASRPMRPNYRDNTNDVERMDYHADPVLALHWARKLEDELKAWIEAMPDNGVDDGRTAGDR